MVTTPGTYIVNMRGRRDREGACADARSDECNDVYTRMNDGDAHKTMIKGSWGQWIWESRYIDHDESSVRPAVYDLRAGTNTLYVSGRSRGVKFDCFVIFLQGTFPPENPATTSVNHQRAAPTVSRRPAAGAGEVFGLEGRKLDAIASPARSSTTVAGVRFVREHATVSAVVR